MNSEVNTTGDEWQVEYQSYIGESETLLEHLSIHLLPTFNGLLIDEAEGAKPVYEKWECVVQLPVIPDEMAEVECLQENVPSCMLNKLLSI